MIGSVHVVDCTQAGNSKQAFLLHWRSRFGRPQDDTSKGNLVPRLSSLHSSLEEETLLNAGHVISKFWEPLGYLLLGRGGFVRYLGECNSCYTCHQLLKRLELHTLTSTTHLSPQESYYPIVIVIVPKSGSHIHQGLFLQRGKLSVLSAKMLFDLNTNKQGRN